MLKYPAPKGKVDGEVAQTSFVFVGWGGGVGCNNVLTILTTLIFYHATLTTLSYLLSCCATDSCLIPLS